MKKPVGIVVASKLKAVESVLGMNIETFIKETAKILAELEFNILIIPERDSGSLLFAKFLKEFNKKSKIYCVIPKYDKEFGIKHLSTKFCDVKIYCKDWRSAASTFVAESAFLLCLSFTAGCLAEVMQSKYWKKKVLVIKELVSKTLPKEAEQQLKVKYISLKELKPILLLVKKHGIKRL